MRAPRRHTFLCLALLTSPAIAGEALRDCPICPPLVVIEAGRVTLGSPPNEVGRSVDGREDPQREVTISLRFALGQHEVTRGEFAAFVAETAYRTDAERNLKQTGCLIWDAEKRNFDWRAGLDWRNPGFAQDDRHPVTCISWNDASAYLRWLSTKAKQTYRLPTEAEWELAARAGSTSSRPWGDDATQACRHANVADEGARSLPEKHRCNDDHAWTAPVGSLLPNGWGVFDMIGNVWEWVADCYRADALALTPQARQAARTALDCREHGLRGGSWFSGPDRARSAYRGGYAAESRSNMYGFRVARTLP